MRLDLYNENNLDILPHLPDNSVDAVVTDPPYFKVKNEAWDKSWDSEANFIQWFDKWLPDCVRVLKPNGSLYVFASNKMAARVEVKIREYFNVLNNIVWNKTIKANQGPQMRSNKEMLRSYYPNCEHIVFAEHYGADNMVKGVSGYAKKCDELRGFVFEPLRQYFVKAKEKSGLSGEEIRNKMLALTGTKYMFERHTFSVSQWALPTEAQYKAAKTFLDLPREYEDLRREYEDLRREYEDLRREYEDLRRPFNVTKEDQFTTVWNFETVQYYSGKHPCEKPLDLMRHIIKTSVKPGGLVLDPFMGSGSTGMAAALEDCGFIGIEMSEEYFAWAEARIAYARDNPDAFDKKQKQTKKRPARPKKQAAPPKIEEMQKSLFNE